MDQLKGKKVAILVAEGFEEVEMTEPRKALKESGAETHLISPEEKKVRSWAFDDWGKKYDVDVQLDEARADQYDALMLPGGVMNPDKLRMNERAVSFIRSFVDSGKPIAAICHASWSLIEAGGVRGRRMTSYPSLQTDLRNAGATWMDQEVVVDQGLVTSRSPQDLPAFNSKMLEEFREGVHVRGAARAAD